MKKILKVTLLSLIVTVIGISARAQSNPLGPGVDNSGGYTGNTNPPGTNADGAVPFDGGLSLILLAAGAGVGAKKRKMLNA